MQIPSGKSLEVATKGLLRGDFNLAVKALLPGNSELQLGAGITLVDENITSAGYRGPTNDLFEFTVDGNGFNYFQYTDINSALKAYCLCPQLQSIINKKAQAQANGRMWVLDKKGKESNSIPARTLKKRLASPNPLQTWSQFDAQAYIYEQIFGYSVQLFIKPVGYKDNIDASSIWNLPPNMVEIKESNRLFYQTDQAGIIDSIVFTYKGERTPLNVEDVLITKDFIPSFSTMILPNSRVSGLAMPINNIMGAYQSRGTLIHYRGALGMFTQDASTGSSTGGALPMTDPMKTDLQNDLKRYGLKRNQIQFIITKASLRWQQVGVPVRDLMLFEEIEDDTMVICDGYNFPFRLMSNFRSNSLGGTDANIFTRNLYDNAIIPEATSRTEQLSNFLKLEDYGLKLDKDFKHVSVMQADKVQEANARKIMNDALSIEFYHNILTLNQWLVKIGEDPHPNAEAGDKYYTELLTLGWTFGKAAPAPKTNEDGNTDTGQQPATGSAAA